MRGYVRAQSAAAQEDRAEDMRNGRDRHGRHRTDRPTQRRRNRRGRGQSVARGERIPLRDVKNEDRSGNVYENKGLCDNLPDTKDDICA